MHWPFDFLFTGTLIFSTRFKKRFLITTYLTKPSRLLCASPTCHPSNISQGISVLYNHQVTNRDIPFSSMPLLLYYESRERILLPFPPESCHTISLVTDTLIWCGSRASKMDGFRHSFRPSAAPRLHSLDPNLLLGEV